MANIKLDFSKMKHVKSDTNSTTLAHPEGHQITLVHSALHPDNQKALSALAQISKSAQTPIDADASKHQMMAEGGDTGADKVGSVPYKIQHAFDPDKTSTTMTPAASEYAPSKPKPDVSQIHTSASSAKSDNSAPNPTAGDQGSLGPGLNNPMAEGGQAKPKPEMIDYSKFNGEQKKRDRIAQPGNTLDYSQWSGKNKPRFDDGGQVDSAPVYGAAEKTYDAQQGATGTPQSDTYAKAKANWSTPTTYTPEQIAAQKAAGYAEGGQAKSAKVPKYCMYCGGMAHGGECSQNETNSVQNQGDPRKMYADPAQEVSATDSAPTQGSNLPPVNLDPNSATTPADKATPNYKDMPDPTGDQLTALSQDADKRQTIQNYNRLAGDVNPKGMTTPVSALQFGPNGEPPAQFDAQNYMKAQQEQTQQKAANAASMAAEQQKIIQENQARAQAGLPLLPVPDIPNGPQIPGSPANTPQPSAVNPAGQPVDSMDASIRDMMGIMKSGYNNQLAGIKGAGEAQANLADMQAKAYQTEQQAQQNVLTTYQKHADDVSKEMDAVRNDIANNHITPENYWTGDKNGNGSHSKIAAGIGMILAGFNPSNKPNAAIDFLKHQMDQNLSAQAQEMGKKQNVLSSLQAKYKNVQDAADMTRIINGQVASAQLGQAAAKATGGPNGLAANAARQAQGQLQMTYAPLQQKIAMSQAMMHMASNPTGDPDMDVAQATKMARYMTAMGQPEQAKAWQQATVPGVGVTKNLAPVPDEVKQQITTHKSVNDLMNMSLEFSKQPIPTNPVEYAKYTAKASAIQGQLIGQIKQAQHDGVYKPSEAEFLTSQIGNSPGSIFRDLSSIPKIQELQNIKQTEYNNLLNTYGLPQRQLPRTNTAAPQYKTVNGVRYMRGPNGEAILTK